MVIVVYESCNKQKHFAEKKGNNLGAFGKISQNFVISVRLSAWNNSASTRRIFMKFGILIYLSKKLSTKFKFYLNLTRITAVLYINIDIYFFISPSFLLE